MFSRARLLISASFLACFLTALLLTQGCASSATTGQAPTRPGGAKREAPTEPAAAPHLPLPLASQPVVIPPKEPFPVMLGIDVLESQNFAAVAGKRIGLLTHPAGVNRQGVSTIDVLRRAPNVRLVALFGPEHGIYGNEAAEIKIPDRRDPRTGLPVYSLYGQFRKPTKAMLKGLDALVIDLQDVGTRSYTYVSCMRYTMEACFEEGVEVVVLDRPNPLGGLKVDGPPLDPQWMSYVGAFPVPYVHGLTIGELARLAAATPGVLAIKPEARAKGRLTIVPMRGWKRSMRWPETGLRWVPTSPRIPDFSACVGYPMTGLGTYLGGFRHGVAERYPFRGILHLKIKSEVIEKELLKLHIPGLAFRRVSVQKRNGEPATGIYVEVIDWDDWRPTELNFYLMQLACRLESPNPFSAASKGMQQGFLRHVGSTAFFEDLVKKGARIDIPSWINRWQQQARAYQQQSKRFWIYPN
ncbi:MAG: DUF1343 domain-containing protein [Opitutaceae bacterium]|nr:DUF1343 domain-containing protein [Opitutaceae bacterium]